MCWRTYPRRRPSAFARRTELALAAGSEQPVAVGVDHGLDAVAQVEFGQNPGDGGLDGRVPDIEAGTDLDVAITGGDEQEHLVLPCSKAIEPRRPHGRRVARCDTG